MTFTSLPEMFSSVFGPLAYTFSNAAETELFLEILSTRDGSRIGSKRFYNTPTGTLNIAPMVRKNIRFVPSSGMTGFCNSESRSASVQLAVGTTYSEVRTFVAAHDSVKPSRILTTMPSHRIIAYGESDEITCCIPGQHTVTVTSDITAEALTYNAIGGEELTLFRLNTRSFLPSVGTITVRIATAGQTVAEIGYTVVPKCDEGCRIAWRSRAGSIEHYTFPVVKSVVQKIRKEQVLTDDAGYEDISIRDERTTTLAGLRTRRRYRSAGRNRRIAPSLEDRRRQIRRGGHPDPGADDRPARLPGLYRNQPASPTRNPLPMKLTIDQIPCDLDPSQRIALDYDAQDLADVRSGNKGHALRLRLPATRTNDRIFGFAAEPYTGQRFNAAQHTAVLSDGEAKLLQGSVRLLSAAYDSDPEGYLIEIRSGTSEWARQAAAEMFNTLGISFSGRLTPTMIRQTWTNNTPVKFFPVCRDEYTPELSSVELIPVERFLSVDDYHPFISAATVVQTLFSEAGYTLESDFLNGEFFRSLYLSGAYSSRDTNALRNHMDFLARRTTTAATTANSDGRVYANPYKSINSVGNFVETVNPNDQNDLGETLTDVFSNNHCFTVEDGEIVFRPMTSVTVAFEYHIRYITDHRILDRNRLKGIDSFYLGDGTEVQGALANRYADRRNSTKPAFQYRAIVFNHTEGNSYRLTCTVNGTAGHAIGEFDSRSALVTTPSGSTVTAPVLLCKAAGSTTYTTYTGDWALYDGYIGETGQTEVEMTVRTNPVTVTPTSPKTFSTIYFYGAEPGMKFSLSRQCTLRPDFTGAPGLNTPISFEDVARHRVRKWVVLDALRHLFNLRFYTDEETRTVYVEPADDFYRLGQTFDWSSRIDRSQPILLGDAAQDAERVRIYKYREADGAVTRLNATLEEPFGQWRLVNDSAAAIDRERNLANPFFSPTVSETECYADAPSALVLRVGDRDAPDTADRSSFTPRIVRYCGMQPLPAGERWGYPSTGDSYPLAAFHRNDPDNGFTLCFEDRDGQQGLHRFYDTQAEQEKRCQHLTLHLRLEPCDIERLFQIQRLAPCIASTFLFRIGGEEVRCTLRRIEGYDPSAASTRCTFTRLPNG